MAESESVENWEKEMSCLTKVMTPPPAWELSEETGPEREWVRSERKEE